MCALLAEPDDFTLKIFHGGKMTDEPRTYVGGDIDYIDFCNADQISLIEIFSMLKEIEVEGGFHVLWYKLPGTNFDKGLFPIDRDAELLTMCELIPPI